MAHCGAVACGHPLTAEAALEVLRAGGNAFDAAVAAVWMACVVEPVLASPAGGGFLLARPARGCARVVDFFAHTPRACRAEAEFLPVHVDFGSAVQTFHVGLGAAATPGVVKGLFHIASRLGTMPMTRLVEPALGAARRREPVATLQRYVLDIVAPIYQVSGAGRHAYQRFAHDGCSNPELADTLEALAREGDELFYSGEIAARLAALCEAGGGHLSAPDLAGYQVMERSPLAVSYRSEQVLTNPPPSAGGTLAGFALKLLEGVPVAGLGFGSPRHVAALAEALAATVDGRSEVLARAAEHGTLDADLLARYRDAVEAAPRARGGTTHVSVVDARGNAAALTLSNGEGCGHFIPGTGIMVNNMLGEEDLNPDGFNRWPADTRLASMMAPTLVIRADDSVLALGSGGSNRIRSAITQVVSNLLDFGDDPARAVQRPRLHSEPALLAVEGGFSDAAVAALRRRDATTQVWPERNLFFGGVHVCEHGPRGFRAAGDPRRGGVGHVA